MITTYQHPLNIQETSDVPSPASPRQLNEEQIFIIIYMEQTFAESVTLRRRSKLWSCSKRSMNASTRRRCNREESDYVEDSECWLRDFARITVQTRRRYREDLKSSDPPPGFHLSRRTESLPAEDDYAGGGGVVGQSSWNWGEQGEFNSPRSGLSSWNNKRQSGITRSFHSSTVRAPPSIFPWPFLACYPLADTHNCRGRFKSDQQGWREHSSK